MKASEFIKKFGWDEARKQIKKPTGIYGAAFDYQFMDELKRLIESHELVESCGGLQSVGEKLTHGMYESRAVIERLKQAIADVESCQ